MFFQYAKNGTDIRNLSVPIFASRERTERLDIALSRSDGLSGERVHDLERSTVNHVLKRSADLRARSHFEFEMKLRFERKPFRDYEEQGEKAAPIASPGGVLSVGSGVWRKEPTDPFTII
ncbi:hypothetical protein KU43_03885 [Mesotoga sp. SC_NapDC2]|nr:hypothetical protein RM69_04120 [Mesotoga sp. SC_NapDC3]PVD16249.1 hypothetical protein V512_004785 [Mesotoga sp. Brook.08.105.5.1]RIZ61236.1 hypothetical protein KU43_03885 [Mesotoga sp. SC_NapDC2]